MRSAEDPEPKSDGLACRYRLMDQRAEGTGTLTVQVTLNDGTLLERAVGAVGAEFAAMQSVDVPGGPSTASDRQTSSTWDYEGMLTPALYVGRAGHVGIQVAAGTRDIGRETLAAVALRVLDSMPDLPFALPVDPILAELNALMGESDAPRDTAGPDPCSLITRSEAEAVLGDLLVQPYRSNGGSALADDQGDSCAYYTRGHRAFVVRPMWTGGRVQFEMAASVEDAVGSAFVTVEMADTLEGAWDEVMGSGTTGVLRFLKGDAMLEVMYGTSSTDLGGATRLARTAMTRL